MDSPDRLYDFLLALGEQIPLFIAIIACMIFALTRLKRQTAVAATVLVGLLLLLLHGPIFGAIYTWVPQYFVDRSQGATPSYYQTIFLVLGLIFHLALAVAFAILLTGIFMKRTPPSNA